MKYFNKELCKKLVKIGCTSNTGLFTGYCKCKESHFEDDPCPTLTQSFSIYDFLSDEEYSKKNCKILDYFYKCFRRELLESKNQESYIEIWVNRVINGKV